MSHVSRDPLFLIAVHKYMLCFEQHIISVQMCVRVTTIILLSCDLIYLPSFILFVCLFVFLSSFFFIATIASSQAAGWDASRQGRMCFHSNKLTHWQDCAIFH